MVHVQNVVIAYFVDQYVLFTACIHVLTWQNYVTCTVSVNLNLHKTFCLANVYKKVDKKLTTKRDIFCKSSLDPKICVLMLCFNKLLQINYMTRVWVTLTCNISMVLLVLIIKYNGLPRLEAKFVKVT